METEDDDDEDMPSEFISRRELEKSRLSREGILRLNLLLMNSKLYYIN